MTSKFESVRSLPFFWFSLAFIGGIVVARQYALPTWVWLALAALVCLPSLILWGLSFLLKSAEINLRASVFLSASLFAAFLGAARFQASIPEIDAFHIAWYNDRDYEVLVTGVLVEPPDYRDSYTNLRLEVEAIDTGSGNLDVDGMILARAWPNEIYEYGERLRLRGYLRTPPENEDFSYRDYLASQGIHAYMSRTEITRLPGQGGSFIPRSVYALKAKALENIYLIFPDPEASLLAGILLGIDTGLPKDLQRAFKDTGTAHIIAISGFNIAIIAGLFFTLFSRMLGKKLGSIAAVLGIVLYTFLVGADAAVVRAAIMGTISIFARQVGRRNDGLNALTLTAAVMALWNPYIPWDVGFQLSFFATLGLILYAEPFQQYAVTTISRYVPQGTAERIAKPLAEYVLFTLAAQLTTLPIMAYHFERISLVSLVANPFILPAQPAVMIVGGVAVLISLVWIPLGAVAAFAAWPFVAYTIRLVELFDRLPHGVIVLGDFSLWFVILFYVTLLTWTLAGNRLKDMTATRREALPTVPAVMSTVVLSIFVLMTWRTVFTLPDGRLHITFLDVGSADAILIETPGGEHILVNGGSSLSLLSDNLGRRLPPIGKRLDLLIVASTQENQLTALPRMVERLPPDQVLWAGNTESSFSARTLEEWFVDQSIPVTRATPGLELALGNGAYIRILSVNSRGAVILVAWNEFRALLPVGMNFDALEELQQGPGIGPVSILSLSDSGYAPINPPEWIESLHPQLVVLSVAVGDLNGLPHQGTLDAVEGYSLLRTDQNGWIHVSTDGAQMWIEVEKQVESPIGSATLAVPGQ